MIIPILIILCLFSISFVALWIWYLHNEKNVHIRFYRKGMKSFNKKNYQDAKTQFLKALSIDPGYKDVISALGSTYIKLKDYEHAKEYVEKFLKSSPKNFNALYNMGLVLQKLEHNDEAKNYYLKAIQENPKSVLCYLNLGIINFVQKDYTTAMDFLEKAKEIQPDNSKVLFYILRCKDETCNYDDHEEGKAIIEEYLNFQNKWGSPKEFNKILARAYAKNGQMEESVVMCQKALENNTEDIDSYKQLGLVQLVKNDLVGAKNSLLTAVHLKPDDQEAHDLLSYVVCQQKSKCAVKRCREQYQEAVSRFFNK